MTPTPTRNELPTMCHYCGEPGADQTDQGWRLHIECKTELIDLGYDWRQPVPTPTDTDHTADTPW